MTTAYTSLLGLALPVTGELSGTWGDTVNTAITSLLDTAVAGTTSITTDADITLSTTTGASNQARQAIILWNPASGTVTRNITAPAQSKLYTVINASGGTQSIVIRGVGPTTGVTIAKGESAQVTWNGSDFVKVGSSGGAITFTDLTVTGNTILGDAAADTLTVNATSTFASPVNFTGQVKLPSTGRSAAAALTPTNPAFLYGVASTYTDTTSSGTLAPVASFYGLAQPTLSTSNVTTYTNASTLYIANAPTTGGSATITNPYSLYIAAGASYFGGLVTATGFAGPLNGTVGATTPTTGAFTTLSATGDLSFPTVGSKVNFATTSSATVNYVGGSADGFSLEMVMQRGALQPLKYKQDFSVGHVWSVTGSDKMTLDSTGNLLVGNTTDPIGGNRLLVQSAATANNNRTMSVYNTAATSTTAFANRLMQLSSSGSGADVSIQFSDQVANNAYIGMGSGALYFAIGSGTTKNMTLDSSGNLGIGTSSPGSYATGAKNLVIASSGDSGMTIRSGTTSNGNLFFANAENSSSNNASVIFNHNDLAFNFDIYGVGRSYRFKSAGTEVMRLDSSGNLGIGTTSPATILNVSRDSGLATGTGTTVAIQIGDTSNDAGAGTWNTTQQFSAVQFFSADTSGVGAAVRASVGATMESVFGSPSALTFFTNGSTNTEKMRLDSSGNLGLGVTPSAWSSASRPALQLTNGAALFSRTGSTFLGQNFFYNASDAGTYIANGFAAVYIQASGQHQWYNAPSGTAGNAAALTQAMTLDASGNLGIGTTTPAKILDVHSSTAGGPNARFIDNSGVGGGGRGGGISMGGTSNDTGPVFTEYVKILGLKTNSTQGNTQGGLLIQVNDGTAFANAMSIDSTGNLTVSTGNVVIGTAGKGIDFSADPSAAGMTSELLDDYEEGTWTPSVGGTATYTTQVGSYTKIGRQITLWFDLTINTLGTGSTTKITGVPVPPVINTNYHTGTVYWENIATNQIALGIYIQQSTGDIYFMGANASAASITNQPAVIGNGATFRGTLTYYV